MAGPAGSVLLWKLGSEDASATGLESPSPDGMHAVRRQAMTTKQAVTPCFTAKELHAIVASALPGFFGKRNFRCLEALLNTLVNCLGVEAVGGPQIANG